MLRMNLVLTLMKTVKQTINGMLRRQSNDHTYGMLRLNLLAALLIAWYWR